jgi:hypothetical protein
MDWFRSGGAAMWFLSAVGIAALLAAASFARRPDLALVPRVERLTSAVVWSMVAGVASDLAEVGRAIPSTPEWAHSPDLVLIILTGISESLTPAVLGAAILSVDALLMAAGHARLRALGSAP